jgi:DNA modification methylase
MHRFQSKIINGDCRDILPSVVREAENPVIVTDPPFNVGYHYDEYADRMDEGAY